MLVLFARFFVQSYGSKKPKKKDDAKKAA